MDFFDVLGQLAQAKCPSCGETTSGYSDVCEACGASLGLETDDPSLNVQDATSSRAGLTKTAMHESGNLLRLKQAVAELQTGGSAEAFVASVDEVLMVVNSALELYTSPYMQDRIAKMEPGPAQVYQQMAAAAKEMFAALQAMRSLNDVDSGLRRFEAGLWKVDAAQDRAIQGATAVAEAGEA